jgi:hypothetical protein
MRYSVSCIFLIQSKSLDISVPLTKWTDPVRAFMYSLLMSWLYETMNTLGFQKAIHSSSGFIYLMFKWITGSKLDDLALHQYRVKSSSLQALLDWLATFASWCLCILSSGLFSSSSPLDVICAFVHIYIKENIHHRDFSLRYHGKKKN